MLSPTGNKLIDSVIYVGVSAIAFNVVLPLFAAAIKIFEILGMV